jgi:hypothetical protein
MKQELFEKEYWEQTLSLKNEWKSIRQIIVCLKWEDINFHNVRNYLLKQVDSQKEEVDNTIQELNENVLRKTSYQLIDDVFIMQYWDVDIKTWEKVYKEFTIPLDLVSKIAYSYSIHWENLSWTKILQKYQLKRDVWMLLKTRLHLTKDENAIPDVILDYIDKHHWEKAVEDKIIEATYSSIESKHINKYKTTYDEILKDEAKKAIHILSQHNNYLEHLQQFIENYKQIEIPTINNTKEYTNDRVQIGFADLHIWKMNTDEVINRIIKLTKYLINRPEKNIDLLFLWDLYEMLAVWGWHPWQIETMDWTFWFELLLAWCSVIEDMITKLYSAWKNITFNWVAWNHDIVSTWEKRDVKKMWWLIAFELMKRKLSNLKIEFNYFKEQINKLILWNTCYIISHWENWISSKADKRPEDLLWKYWDQTRNNVIMYWHLHNVNIKETKDATVIWLPGLAGVGQYDKDLWLMSDTGVIVVNENEDKRIDVLIKRL